MDKNIKEISVGPTLVPVAELEQALDNTQRWLDDLISPFLKVRRAGEERKRQAKES
jgi:hypothetical protein